MRVPIQPSTVPPTDSGQQPATAQNSFISSAQRAVDHLHGLEHAIVSPWPVSEPLALQACEVMCQFAENVMDDEDEL